MKKIIPRALKMHADRLLVKPVRGPLKLPVVRYENSTCRYFRVPTVHLTKGAENADMVLYVAAGTDNSTWAVPCDTWGNDRPKAGAMHIYLRDLAWQMFNARRAAHEIAHALGFDYERMKRLGMLSMTKLRGANVTVISSSRTMEMGKKHYGCNTFPGMPLEDWKSGKVKSQYALKFAKDELMGPWPSLTAGHYTALTLAVFEDMGYYRANWEMAEPMKWGNATKCDLFTQLRDRNSKKVSHRNMFCRPSDTHLRCSSDRSSVGVCLKAPNGIGMKTNATSMIIPFYMHVDSQLHYSMCDIEAATFIPASRTGRGSKCLDVETFNVPSIRDPNIMKPVSGVCAQVNCEGGKVQVRYKGNENWHNCTEGKRIETNITKGPKTIICPKYEEVCMPTTRKNTHTQ